MLFYRIVHVLISSIEIYLSNETDGGIFFFLKKSDGLWVGLDLKSCSHVYSAPLTGGRSLDGGGMTFGVQ